MKRGGNVTKGKVAERKAAKFLTGLGFPCERNARNGKSEPDLCFSVGVLEFVHVEVKHDKKIGLGTKLLTDALEQAHRDAGAKTAAAVLWFEHAKGWRLTFIARTASGQKSTLGIVTVFRDHDIHGALTALNTAGLAIASAARESAMDCGVASALVVPRAFGEKTSAGERTDLVEFEKGK